MLKINFPLTYKLFDIKIQYNEIKNITDFDYLVILLSNHALDNNLSIKDVLEKYTITKNDLTILFMKRFEDLFGVGVSKYIEKKDEIIKSKEFKKKYVNSESTMNIHYNSELEHFLYRDELIDSEHLDKIIKEIFTTNNREYIKHELIDSKKLKQKNEEIILNDSLSKFDILNLSNQSNSEILEEILIKLKKESLEYLPADTFFENVLSIKNYLPITRSYFKGDSKYIEIKNIEDDEQTNKIEWNKNSKEIIYSDFVLFEDIPFLNEKIMHFSEFQKTNEYSEMLNWMFSANKSFIPEISELILNNTISKNELKVFSKIGDFRKIRGNLFDRMIDLMIEHNINIIDDTLYIKNDLYENFIQDKYLKYYEFINQFRFVNLLDEIRLIRLLDKIYSSKDKNVLIQDHLDYIREKKEEADYYCTSILNTLSNVNMLRGEVDKLQNKNKDDDNKIIDIKLEEELKNWKQIFNFLIHINDSKKQKHHNNNIDSVKNLGEEWLIELREKLENPFLLNEELHQKTLALIEKWNEFKKRIENRI